MEDSPHNGDRLGSGGGRGWVGGLRSGGWVGGVYKVGGVGSTSTFLPPGPQPPLLQSSRPNPPRLQAITVVWRIFHIGTVASICPTLTLKISVTFVCLTRCVANLLCGESSVANLPCGESSGNLKILPAIYIYYRVIF